MCFLMKRESEIRLAFHLSASFLMFLCDIVISDLEKKPSAAPFLTNTKKTQRQMLSLCSHIAYIQQRLTLPKSLLMLYSHLLRVILWTVSGESPLRSHAFIQSAVYNKKPFALGLQLGSWAGSWRTNYCPWPEWILISDCAAVEGFHCCRSLTDWVLLHYTDK